MEKLQFYFWGSKKLLLSVSRQSLNGRQKPSVYSLCTQRIQLHSSIRPAAVRPIAVHTAQMKVPYINIDRKCESQKQYTIFGNSDAAAAAAAAEAERKNRKEEWQMNE